MEEYVYTGIAGAIAGLIITIIFRLKEDPQISWGDSFLLSSGFALAAVMFLWWFDGWLKEYHL